MKYNDFNNFIKRNMGEKIYLVLLHSIGFSHKKLFEIFKEKENYKDFYESFTNKDLIEIGIRKNQIETIFKNKEKINIKKIKEKIQERGVNIITYNDSKYPEQLKSIPNKPFLLYIRGKLNSDDNLSIVGARKISNYGEKVIEKIVPELSKAFNIVSGGAFGCDSKAHHEALKSNGITIAVLGTGIDIDYPTSNKNMYEKIVEKKGAIISIFPIGTKGSNYTFPIRNEIVAGLSKGTLVIEAKEKSGSLITAKLCLELGKDLFAIPGDIFIDNYSGTNKLISDGEAKLVRNSNDILVEYGIKAQKIQKKKIIFEDEVSEKIYDIISKTEKTSDEIARFLETDITIINLKISAMEITGLLKKISGGKYSII